MSNGRDAPKHIIRRARKIERSKSGLRVGKKEANHSGWHARTTAPGKLEVILDNCQSATDEPNV
jgi:hypothetical protein